MQRIAETLGTELFRPTTLRRLFVGVVLFLLIKIMFVSVGLTTKHGPRLGDDAYVYLWFSMLNHDASLLESPGVTAISKFADGVAPEQLGYDERFGFYRVLMRYVGHPKNNFLHGVFGSVTESADRFFVAFWLQEVVVAIAMAAGLFVLFAAASRPPGLAFSLPLVALALFPDQGIHFLIPSTLSLSFGMMVWGLVMLDRARPVALGLAGLAAMLAHTIGIAHAGAGGLLVVVRYFMGAINLRRASIEGGVLVVSLSAYIILITSGFLQRGESLGFIHITPDRIDDNIAGLLQRLVDSIRQDLLAAIVVVAGGYALASHLPTDRGHYVALAGILVGLSAIASVYHIEGYEGDVMARMLVPVAIICAAFVYANKRQGAAIGNPVYRRLAAYFFVIFFAVMSINIINYALRNWEKRWPELDKTAIAQAFADIDGASKLLYFREDFAQQAAFIAGGHRFFTSSYSMLAAEPAKGRRWLATHRPDYAVTLVPRGLLPDRKYDQPWWGKRRYGFPLDKRSALSVWLPLATERLFVRIDPGELLVVARAGNLCAQAEPYKEWIEIALATCGDNDDEIALEFTGNAFVSGLRTSPPDGQTSWPWGQTVRFGFESRSWNGDTYTPISSDFAFSTIAPELGDRLFSEVTIRPKVVDDRSGLLLIELNSAR